MTETLLIVTIVGSYSQSEMTKLFTNPTYLLNINNASIGLIFPSPFTSAAIFLSVLSPPKDFANPTKNLLTSNAYYRVAASPFHSCLSACQVIDAILNI